MALQPNVDLRLRKGPLFFLLLFPVFNFAPASINMFVHSFAIRFLVVILVDFPEVIAKYLTSSRPGVAQSV